MTCSNPYPRADWPRLLCALPANDVKRTAQDLESEYTVEDLMLPQSGLGLLQLCDSTLSERYFLGEIPVARAHVRITGRDGRIAEGAAQILDDRASLVRALAILDAVLASGLPEADAVQKLLRAGAGNLEQPKRERRALLNATRVDFAMLGTADEEFDDE